VLLARTRQREKHHPLKDMGLDEARHELAAERRSLEEVLREISAAGSVRIRVLDTTDASVGETVGTVLRCIDAVGASREQV